MANPINLNKLKQKVDSLEIEIKQIKNDMRLKNLRLKIKNGTFYIELKKSFINASFESKTELTDLTQDYILTYLLRTSNEKAVFYWEQARNNKGTVN